jgi:hypothetical protein
VSLVYVLASQVIPSLLQQNPLISGCTHYYSERDVKEGWMQISGRILLQKRGK